MVAYINNTGTDVTLFHAAILAAIANDGKFDEDLSDIFVLIKTPDGAVAEYALYFA